MISHSSQQPFLGSLLLALVLVLAGCSSTGSNSNDDDSDSTPQVSFNSGTISPDQNFSYTFKSEGDFEYYCQIHAPDMQGKITVSSSVDAAERDTVYMDGMTFNPRNLSVAPNTEVVWINRASIDHNVTSGNPAGGGGDY